MSNIALLIERTTAGMLGLDENVIFENVMLLTGNISYDSVTGQITLLETGKYKFDWLAATHTSISTEGIGFALVSSQGETIIGNSPINKGEVSGTGIIEVSLPPVTVTLQNNSNSPIFYSSVVPVKSLMTVIKIPDISSIGQGMQLQHTASVIPIDDNQPVIFDSVISNSNPNISYNPATGEVSFTKAGNYFVSWSVQIGGSITASITRFGIQINSTQIIEASSDLLALQLSGQALIPVTAVPTAFTLLNISGGTVVYASAPVVADLIVMEFPA